MATMGRFVGEAMKAGVLLDTGGVMGDGLSLKVRRDGSKITVVDGPFAEDERGDRWLRDHERAV
jgi:hypothetical protein